MIIPARNAAGTIGHQLDALGSQTLRGPWELIVVDDGSADGTRSVIHDSATWFDQLRIIDGPRRGAGAARNVGASTASGHLLLFCDADDIVDSRWLERMVARLEDADACGGHCAPFSTEDHVAPGLRSAPVIQGLFEWHGYLPYAISANFGIRKTVFEAIGGFNEGSAAEDVDLCWRLQERGYTLTGAPDAIVQYRLRGDARSLMRQRFAYGKRKPWLYARHRDAGMPPSGLLHGLRRWFGLAVMLPWSLRNRSARLGWLDELAFRAGAVAGSIKHRTLHL